MNKEIQEKLLDIVKNNYEQIAEDFHETRKKYLWPELFKLTKDVRSGDKILDAGCGNGRLTEAFKDKKIKYLGIDNSENLIRLAREKYSGYEFRVGNILELDKLSEKYFDYIFSIAVLHHLPGQDLQIKALRQMKNKIKEDGKIILTVWNLWTQKKFRKIIFKSWLLKLAGKNKADFGDVLFDWQNNKGEIVSQRYYHAFRKCELKRIIKKAGLKTEKIYKDKYNYYMVLTK